MIFSPKLEREVRNGKKTQTRRPVRGPLHCPTCNRQNLAGICISHTHEVRTVPVDPGRYHPGKSYAVQPGRGKAASCRIRILEVEHQLAGDITLPDAIAEGFRTTDEFKTYWVDLHDKAWLAKQRKTVEQAQADADPDDAVVDVDRFLTARSLDRFHSRHAHRAVWLILFELDETPKPRFLAARSQELYVTSAARALAHEPEAVTAEEQRQITERANMTTQQWTAHATAQRDRDRALLSREEQIVRLQRAARLRSVDVSREVWALRNSLNSANFETKVARTEAKIFKMAA